MRLLWLLDARSIFSDNYRVLNFRKRLVLVSNQIKMNKLLLCFFLLFSGAKAFGQLRVSDAGFDVCSRHIWRGDKLGTAPAFEPTVTVADGRFSFNFWASVTTNNSYSEIDLTPAWQFKHFQLTLFDYYNPVPGAENRYFQFWEKEGRHSLELVADNYSLERQRFKWFAATFLLGDRNDETEKPFYSTYFEFKYPFIAFGLGAEPFIGMTPSRGYYADRAAVINSGISLNKELPLTSYLSLPLSVSFIYNPYREKTYLVFSAGIFLNRAD